MKIHESKRTAAALLIAASISAGSPAVVDGAINPNIPDWQRMQAPASRILGSREYVESNGVQSVRYAYRSDVTRPKRVREVLEKRTPSSISEFVKSEVVKGQVKNIYTATIYAGPQFFQENNKWYIVEYATTTKEIFNKAVNKNSLFGIIPKAQADTIYSSTADGWVYKDTCTWSTCRSAADGSSFSSTDVTNRSASTVKDVTLNAIGRGFFYFDTSSIGSGNTVTAATLNLYLPSGWVFDELNDANSYITTVQGTQADTLSTADFDQVGSTKWSDDQDLTTLAGNTNAYNTWTFNSTGQAGINVTGTTKIAVREGHDFDNVDPGTGALKYSEMGVRYADNTGTSQDPYLSVTYVAGNSCTAPASGNWWIKASDNCFVSTDTYVQGSCNIIASDGPGTFNIIDGKRLACHGINNTSTPINAENGSFIDLDNQ